MRLMQNHYYSKSAIDIMKEKKNAHNSKTRD